MLSSIIHTLDILAKSAGKTCSNITACCLCGAAIYYTFTDLLLGAGWHQPHQRHTQRLDSSSSLAANGSASHNARSPCASLKLGQRATPVVKSNPACVNRFSCLSPPSRSDHKSKITYSRYSAPSLLLLILHNIWTTFCVLVDFVRCADFGNKNVELRGWQTKHKCINGRPQHFDLGYMVCVRWAIL